MKYEDWQIITVDKVASTNDTVRDYCCEKGQAIALRAIEQTSGRGRRGRVWHSLKGNLFLSLAFEYKPENIGKLVIVSALSLWQTIKNCAPTTNVKIKWPNDILVNNAKVSGMLLEKGEDDYIIIGIGVNIKQAPENKDILYPATSLANEGIVTSSEDFTPAFLQIFSHYFNILQRGEFAMLRKMWTANAKGIGKKIFVNQENIKKEGIFLGIDDDGCLLLNTANGKKKILVGDVFYIEKENDVF